MNDIQSEPIRIRAASSTSPTPINRIQKPIGDSLAGLSIVLDEEPRRLKDVPQAFIIQPPIPLDLALVRQAKTQRISPHTNTKPILRHIYLKAKEPIDTIREGGMKVEYNRASTQEHVVGFETQITEIEKAECAIIETTNLTH